MKPNSVITKAFLSRTKAVSVSKKLLPNFDNLMEEVLDWDYDPGNKYSVPYFWGNVGLLYNTEAVDEDDLYEQGYGIMINPKYSGRIYVYNSERDAFMMALKALGYSMNTTNEKEIDEAYQWLLLQKKTMRPIYVEDDSIDNMVSGLKDIALMYSGDAVYVIGENEDMAFYIPEGGSNLWIDAMVIPANSKCTDLAYEWIDFQLRPEIAQANTEEVCYTTTVAEVFEEVTGVGGEFKDSEAYIVRTDNPGDEIFHYNAEIKKILADLWTRVLAQ
jgi:spermidine/putrescine transport system substrate-binding protein/spermidine/putrescine transport system permease protein